MNDPFKMVTPLSQTTSRKQNPKVSGFLEALREQGKAATTGVANNAVDQLRGVYPNQEPSPSYSPDTQPAAAQAPFNFAEFLKMREERIRQQERAMSQQHYREESVIFYRKEELAKQEIEAIKKEIRKIIETTSEMSSELLNAEQSVMDTTVEAGTYHLNFFQRLRQVLVLVRKRLTESKHWMDAFNSRSQQKSFYWGQVQKSGTKYMLSQERYMSTQAG